MPGKLDKELLKEIKARTDSSIEHARRCDLSGAIDEIGLGHGVVGKYIGKHTDDISPHAVKQASELLFKESGHIASAIRYCVSQKKEIK